ncbi:unnamed protein product [Notodromas monacha]|uniref:FAM86 N-terminal domain-containing protein n=1 Tax=Notodromas monacha TaxID=399045 RepID=A0A7R9BIT5_9CRUS|nr:unnamed protein product [Notodromas monacha]CAG0916313.1 unnamed protein product [Notodromas monacha]
MMEDGRGDSAAVELEALCQKFLCHHPLTDVSFAKLFENATSDQPELQIRLLSCTLKHPIAERYPLPRAYRRDFLKSAIHEMEGRHVEVLPEIYELYLSLCSYDPDEDFSHKSYKLSVGDQCDWVHIKESRSIASDGSTGVHSWPAGVALANWCLQNTALLDGKIVLELGSGVGLTGLIAVKACNCRTYVFSDYHPQVFKKIRENLVMNNIVCLVDKNDENGASEESDEDGRGASPAPMKDIRVLRLDWRYKGVMPSNLDFVIGSDLIFEPDLINPLVDTIDRLLQVCGPQCTALIAVTERNPETVAKFESEVDGRQLVRSVVEYDSHQPLLWAAKHETVKLYSIKRR